MDSVRFVIGDDGVFIQLKRINEDFKQSNTAAMLVAQSMFVPNDDIERQFVNPFHCSISENDGNSPIVAFVMSECRNILKSSLPDYITEHQLAFNYATKNGRHITETQCASLIVGLAAINYDLFNDIDMARMNAREVLKAIGHFCGTVRLRHPTIYHPPLIAGMKQGGEFSEFIPDYESLEIVVAGYQRLFNSWCLPHIPEDLRCLDETANGRALWLVVCRVRDEFREEIARKLRHVMTGTHIEKDAEEVFKKQPKKKKAKASSSSSSETAAAAAAAPSESNNNTTKSGGGGGGSAGRAAVKEPERNDEKKKKKKQDTKGAEEEEEEPKGTIAKQIMLEMQRARLNNNKSPYPTPWATTTPSPPPPPPPLPTASSGPNKRKERGGGDDDDGDNDNKTLNTDYKATEDLIRERMYRMADRQVSVAVSKVLAYLEERPDATLDKAISVAIERQRRPGQSFWRILPWVTEDSRHIPSVENSIGTPIYVGTVTSVNRVSARQITAMQYHTFPHTAEWLDEAQLLPTLTVVR